MVGHYKHMWDPIILMLDILPNAVGFHISFRPNVSYLKFCLLQLYMYT